MAAKVTVYITYSRADDQANPAILNDVISTLEQQGYDVWCDRKLKAGRNFAEQLLEQAYAREVFIALLGEHALESRWVPREIDTARAGGAAIVPIIIDNVFRISDLDAFLLLNVQAHPYVPGLLNKLPAIIDELGVDVRLNRLENATRTTIFGKPLVDDRFQCDIFMIMPFSEQLNPIYREHIVRLVNSMGLVIKRGDDPFAKHGVISDIWSLTYNARMVIAECTGKNPNVFYEMGIAHTLGKAVIPITQDSEHIPFDIRQFRYIEYEYTPPGMKDFENELEQAIRSLMRDL